jgi:hypothetical protein
MGLWSDRTADVSTAKQHHCGCRGES